MLLLALIIFLIRLIFLTKDPVWNKRIACFVLTPLKELIQAKYDMSSPYSGVIHAGGELAVVGDNITRMDTNSYTTHHKIDLSRFINYQQSCQSTTA